MPIVETITDEQSFTMTIRPTSKGGRERPIDGKATWSLDEGAPTDNFVVAEDGMSAKIMRTEDPTVFRGRVEADADLGEGVVTIKDTFEVTVVDSNAENLNLSGTKTDEPVE